MGRCDFVFKIVYFCDFHIFFTIKHHLSGYLIVFPQQLEYNNSRVEMSGKFIMEVNFG